MGNLYEDLGGEPAVDAAVDIFYRKVLNDEGLNPFFDGINIKRQKKMQKAFLTVAFGGPNNYTGRGMRAAHQRQSLHGLNDSHFDAVVHHLGMTLRELGVDPNKIQQAANIAESVRHDVLNH